MKKVAFLLGLFLFLSYNLISQETDTYPGIWLGHLKISEEMSLQIAFEITNLENKAYAAKMNVIEQKAFDIPMDQCKIEGDSVKIAFMGAGILYNGLYTKSGEIVGTYEQGGASFPLIL